MNEITYFCAGINHQAFYLSYKWNGKDAYPLIRKAILKKPEIYNAEHVRNEMYLALDYYVTESSGHNSEYNAWFRKRPELVEKYCTSGTNWNPGHHAYILNEYLKRENNWKNDVEAELKKPLDKDYLKRGHEYAASIFNAVFGNNNMFEFNGNVRNKNLISNLPSRCCVEVPVMASRRGLDAISVGELPAQLAVLNNISARCEELAVEGALNSDARMIYHAILFDPLTSAVLSLEEIRNMVNEMFKANKDYLPRFKTLTISR